MEKKLKSKGKALSAVGLAGLLALTPVAGAFAFSVASGSSGGGGSGTGTTSGVKYAVWVGSGNVETARKGILSTAGYTDIAQISDISNKTRVGKWPGGDLLKTSCNAALKKVKKGRTAGKVVAVSISYKKNAGMLNYKKVPSTWGVNSSTFKSNTATSKTKSKVNTKFSTKNKYQKGLNSAINSAIGNVGSSQLSVHCVAASAADLKKVDPNPTYKFSTTYNKDNKSTIEGVYSENISLTSQIMAKGTSSGWKDQTITQKTAYGKKLDSYIKTYKDKDPTKAQSDTIAKNLKAAIKDDEDNPKEITIDMTDANKKAFADGGVVNVTKNSQKRKTVLNNKNSGTVNFTNCSAGKKADAQAATKTAFAKAKTEAEVKTAAKTISTKYKCSNDITGQKVSPTLTSPTPATATPVAFWQMLSVHCNQAGFDKLLNETSGAVLINSGDSTKNISAVMKSKRHKSVPANVDFGRVGTESGKVDFYDKECPFDCVADPDTDNAKKNGADNNITSTYGKDSDATKVNNLYGAKSGETNGNVFTFFRDNEPKNIDVDLWYPVDGGNGVVSYNGDKAKTTTITRWKDGTPSLTGKEGGKFSMNAIDGNTKVALFSNNDKVKNQKNWNQATDSTTTAEILKGQYNNFDVSATWASDKDKPQVLNFKWEYAPDVSTRVPSKGLGFTAVDHGRKIGTMETVSRQIEGKCYANFGTDKSNDTTTLFQKYTGTGTTNKLETGPVNDNTSKDYSTNLLLQFVRATTE